MYLCREKLRRGGVSFTLNRPKVEDNVNSWERSWRSKTTPAFRRYIYILRTYLSRKASERWYFLHLKPTLWKTTMIVYKCKHLTFIIFSTNAVLFSHTTFIHFFPTPAAPGMSYDAQWWLVDKSAEFDGKILTNRVKIITFLSCYIFGQSTLFPDTQVHLISRTSI